MPRPGAPLLTLPLTLLATLAAAQAPPPPQTLPHFPLATLQIVQPGDTPAIAAARAASVLPRPNQIAWMRRERTFFIHFGPNTFNGVEWGTGHEDPKIFNPTALNADQWVRAVKDAGGKEIILVTKHHDGFNLWPSRYNPHSVAASPWRGGHGNLVREVSLACQKHGIAFGVYLSPADLYQLRTNTSNPHGLYGDGSTPKPTTIPTDPATFLTNPAAGRPAPAGKPTFHFTVDDYNRYFLNQLYELLTEYGPIQEVWFDGANPDPSVKETYDFPAWYSLIRKLQPTAIIFGKGPDARWVGNEQGIGRTTEWSVIPLPESPQTYTWPDQTAEDLGSRARLVPGSYLWWDPAEVDVPILYGWFWNARRRSRSAADLVDIFYNSVGRNGSMLLNLSPDTRGLIPESQLVHLRLAAHTLDSTFAHNLATGARITADTTAPHQPAALALDGNLDTWWQAAPNHTTATLTLTLPHPATFDVVSLQEAVDHRSQRVETFTLESRQGSSWQPLPLRPSDETTTIGHKRLLRLATPVTASAVRLRITGARLEPTLAAFGLFKQTELLPAPEISERSAAGTVTITSPGRTPIRYTTDGSIPTLASPLYTGPLSLPAGGEVQAAAVTADNHLGTMASRYFAGLAPTGWTITAADSAAPGHPATNAIDGNPATLWISEPSKSPHTLTVDMGRAHRIAGFTYLPRLDGSPAGIVDTFRFETSTDGTHWSTAIPSGTFSNIRNNPVVQEIPFAPVEARFFRFTALHTLDNAPTASAAEISVTPAP